MVATLPLKCVAKKMSLYGWEVISPQGCNFWIGGLVYDRRCSRFQYITLSEGFSSKTLTRVK